jgi:hypothetical protein
LDRTGEDSRLVLSGVGGPVELWRRGYGVQNNAV